MTDGRTDNYNFIPSEARSLAGLSRGCMASAPTFRVASKRSFLLATASKAVSLTLGLPNMDGYLQENAEWLQAHRFHGFSLSCSKVCVGFKSSPIFQIVSCCFFIRVKDIKHGFLFSENLTLAILYQFWRTGLTLWL